MRSHRSEECAGTHHEGLRKQFEDFRSASLYSFRSCSMAQRVAFQIGRLLFAIEYEIGGKCQQLDRMLPAYLGQNGRPGEVLPEATIHFMLGFIDVDITARVDDCPWPMPQEQRTRPTQDWRYPFPAGSARHSPDRAPRKFWQTPCQASQWLLR